LRTSFKIPALKFSQKALCDWQSSIEEYRNLPY
jgi:hypothetical protein